MNQNSSYSELLERIRNLPHKASIPISGPARKPFFDPSRFQEKSIAYHVTDLEKTDLSYIPQGKPVSSKIIKLGTKIAFQEKKLRARDLYGRPFWKKKKCSQEKVKGTTKNSSSVKFIKGVSLEIKRDGDKEDFLKDFRKNYRRIDKFSLSLKEEKVSKESEHAVNPDDPGLITDAGFKQICEEMKKLVFLKHLRIEIDGCKSLTDLTIESLAKCLEKYSRLEDFELSITECEGFTNEAPKILSRSMKRLGSLKNLSLIGPNSLLRIQDEDLISFSKDLRKMKSLKGLYLHFCQPCQIKSQGFESLCQSFVGMSRLESLDLCFERCLYTTLERAIRSLDSGLSQVKSLTNLRLNLGRCLQGRNAIDFVSFLEKHQYLKNTLINLQENRSEIIKMKFDDNNRFYLAHNNFGTNEELRSLAQYLNRNQLMTSVTLDLSESCKIDNTVLEILGETLKDNPKIKELALDLSNHKELTDKGLASFVPCLNPSAIQSLYLKFKSDTGLTEEGFVDFSEALERLSELRFLHLDFQWCKKLKDKALEGLVRSLSGMSSLEDLNLNFSNCGGFTDEAFSLFQEGFIYLPNLAKLSLSFNRNELLTDKGVIYLTDMIKCLGKLPEVHLNLSMCGNIQSHGLDYLEEQLKDVGDIYVNIDKWRWRSKDRNCGEQVNSLTKEKTVKFPLRFA